MREISENGSSTSGEGCDQGWIVYFLFAGDSEMFQAIGVLCVVDVEFEHGGGEQNYTWWLCTTFFFFSDRSSPTALSSSFMILQPGFIKFVALMIA